MTSEKFYDLCDVVEELPFNITNGYFPTKEEVEWYLEREDVEKQIPMLLFFATNPLKNYDLTSENKVEYEKMVKFVSEFVTNYQLED